jgi:hypothetical protein
MGGDHHSGANFGIIDLHVLAKRKGTLSSIHYFRFGIVDIV